MLRAGLALLVTAACASHAARDTDDKALAERVAVVFETHCGACHMSILPTSLPAALEVFDLSRGPGWDDAMTEARWASALQRLDAAASAPEVEIVKRWLARRR